MSNGDWRGQLPQFRSGDEDLDGPRLRNLVSAVEVIRGALINFADYVGVNGMVIAKSPKGRSSLTVTNGGGDARLVRVQLDDTTAGSPGTATSPCGFKYFIYPKVLPEGTLDFNEEDRIQPTSVAPQKARTPRGAYRFNGAGLRSFGLAAKDPDDPEAWLLLIAFDEVEDITDC